MKRPVKTIFLTAGLALSAHAIQAEEPSLLPVNFIKDTGSVERIESGEHLRIYSQQVAAAACFYYNGIEVEHSAKIMNEARTGFDMHLAALTHGDETLGIVGGEERRKTIVQLEEINALWSEMAHSVDALMTSSDNSAAVNVIKDQNMPLFELTNILVSDLEGQYANPVELTQADVLTIEIVGRQAALTQVIAKNVCKIWSGRNSAEILQDLDSAISVYETSLNALLNGMPEVGLAPAPTDEIAAGLTQVLSDWSEIRPIVDAIKGGSISEDELTYLFRHMADEMHTFEDVTHQYVLLSKKQY
ncbi:MAG: type IV pili methyl-accepting chemotaxis transducer N-terminal domain-containing protein [Paracoccaceae bacterium]